MDILENIEQDGGDDILEFYLEFTWKMVWSRSFSFTEFTDGRDYFTEFEVGFEGLTERGAELTFGQ